MFDMPKQAVMYPLHRDNKPLQWDTGVKTFPLERSLRDRNNDAEKVKLRKAAEGFEAIFLRKLLNTMRATMSENTMFGPGVSGEIYGDILDSAVADALAGKNILGFAGILYRSLVKSIGTVQTEDF